MSAAGDPRPDRSGRPVKTRRNRRPDRRRVKLLRSYTIDEVARTLGVHRNTVRHWIKAGMRVIDDKRPILILGNDLAEYLLRRREARRQPCRTGQMFCLKCRKPQEPAGQMADFVASSATSGALVGMPCLQLSHVPARFGRSIVRGRGRTRRTNHAGTATNRGYRHPQRELSLRA
jgi:hypothetical protein